MYILIHYKSNISGGDGFKPSLFSTIDMHYTVILLDENANYTKKIKWRVKMKLVSWNVNG